MKISLTLPNPARGLADRFSGGFLPSNLEAEYGQILIHIRDDNLLDQMGSAKETVEAQIAASPVVVYSKSYCPYCTKVKELLTQLGAKYEVVELDQISGGSEQQDALEQITGQSTVPNVFVGGKSIGGNSDVQKLHKAGNLESLLAQNGAL